MNDDHPIFTPNFKPFPFGAYAVGVTKLFEFFTRITVNNILSI